MKPWVRRFAVCECYGEGAGNLFLVTAVKGNMVWLVGLDPPGAMNPLGWKDLKGCYRTTKARKAERLGK